MEGNGSKLQKLTYETAFLDPFLNIEKNNSVKKDLDARFCNWDQPAEWRPLELLVGQFARSRKPRNLQLISCMHLNLIFMKLLTWLDFFPGDKLAVWRDEKSIWPQNSSLFSAKQNSNIFDDLIKQEAALVFIEYFSIIPPSKLHTLQQKKQLHVNTYKKNLKLAPRKSFLKFLNSKYLSHEMGYITFSQSNPKTSCPKTASPTTQTELLRFIGSMNIHSKIKDKLHAFVELLWFTSWWS